VQTYSGANLFRCRLLQVQTSSGADFFRCAKKIQKQKNPPPKNANRVQNAPPTPLFFEPDIVFNPLHKFFPHDITFQL
jgi:hypothetical protein